MGDNGTIIHTNDSTGTAVGETGTIIRTIDRGANWVLQDSGTESDLRALVFVDPDTAYSVGRGGTIVYTTDGGQNWTMQASGTEQTLQGVAFSDPSTGTVVGSNGAILRTTTGGIVVSVRENLHAQLPGRHLLKQNYPNPFNPITSIRYELPFDSEVSLIIYNLLGEEVARLVDKHQPTGSYSVTWDASSIASGIYFYRLQAGDFVQTRKMALLK